MAQVRSGRRISQLAAPVRVDAAGICCVSEWAVKSGYSVGAFCSFFDPSSGCPCSTERRGGIYAIHSQSVSVDTTDASVFVASCQCGLNLFPVSGKLQFGIRTASGVIAGSVFEIAGGYLSAVYTKARIPGVVRHAVGQWCADPQDSRVCSRESGVVHVQVDRIIFHPVYSPPADGWLSGVPPSCTALRHDHAGYPVAHFSVWIIHGIYPE